MLRLDPVNETYLDTLKLIKKIFFEFIKSRPWLRPYEEDLLSECNLLFLKSYKSHSLDKGVKYTTWLKLKMTYYLRTLERNMRRTKKRMPTKYLEELESQDIVDKPAWEVISDDAEEVMSLALRPPPDIKLYTKNKEPKGKVMYHALFSFLKDIGWASSRILESFQEIREVFR